jgi:hypothetical protein
LNYLFDQPLAAELPRNAMGKVVKAALRAAHAGLYRPPEIRAGRCARLA